MPQPGRPCRPAATSGGGNRNASDQGGSRHREKVVAAERQVQRQPATVVDAVNLGGGNPTRADGRGADPCSPPLACDIRIVMIQSTLSGRR